MKKGALICLLGILVSCSTDTVYTVNFDLLSFIDISQRQFDLLFPPLKTVDIYLLPGVQLDLNQTGPDAETRKGIKISFPTQNPGKVISVSLELSIQFTLVNNSISDSITGNKLSLYMAPSESEDIYTEGIKIDFMDVEPVLPGDSSVQCMVFEAGEFPELIEFINQGQCRLGIGANLAASAESVPALFCLDQLELSLEFTLLQGVIEILGLSLPHSPDYSLLRSG